MLTFGDVKASPEIRAVISFCPDSADFAAVINQVTRKLARRGDWAGTVVPIYVCVYNGCVTWPRYVGSVRKINLCRREVDVKNLWYDFLFGERGRECHWASMMGASCTMVQTGKTSVFQDIQGEGRTVRAYPRCQVDIGKTVTIYGQDNNGQDLMQRDANNNWIAGMTITLASPYGSTSTFVRHIDYVLKDQTQCPVNLFAYNATTDLLEDLAQYDPSETRPSYQRTRLGGMGMGGGGCQTTCCGRKNPVLALVKLKFIPVIADTDLVLIDNLDALVLEIQANKAREAGDIASMRAFQADAIAELNRDLEDQSPEDEFSATNNVFGGRTFSQTCF